MNPRVNRASWYVCLSLLEQEVEELQKEHCETTLFSHLEALLTEKNCAAAEKDGDQIA